MANGNLGIGQSFTQPIFNALSQGREQELNLAKQEKQAAVSEEQKQVARLHQNRIEALRVLKETEPEAATQLAINLFDNDPDTTIDMKKLTANSGEFNNAVDRMSEAFQNGNIELAKKLILDIQTKYPKRSLKSSALKNVAGQVKPERATREYESIAKSMGYATFSMVPTERVGEVFAKAIELAGDKEFARALSGNRANLQKRLTPAEVKQFINPKTFKSYTTKNTRKEAYDDGAVQVLPKEWEALKGVKETQNVIQVFNDTSKELITSSGGTFAALENYLRNGVGEMFRNNPKASRLKSLSGTMIPMLRNSLGGEVGVMTEDDARRFAQMIPLFFESKETRDAKMGLLEELAEMARTARMLLVTGNYSEFAKSTYQTRYDEIVQEIDPEGKTLGKTVGGGTSAIETSPVDVVSQPGGFEGFTIENVEDID